MTDIAKEFRVAQVIVNSLDELEGIEAKQRVFQYVGGVLSEEVRKLQMEALMQDYAQQTDVPEWPHDEDGNSTLSPVPTPDISEE